MAFGHGPHWPLNVLKFCMSHGWHQVVHGSLKVMITKCFILGKLPDDQSWATPMQAFCCPSRVQISPYFSFAWAITASMLLFLTVPSGHWRFNESRTIKVAVVLGLFFLSSVNWQLKLLKPKIWLAKSVTSRTSFDRNRGPRSEQVRASFLDVVWKEWSSNVCSWHGWKMELYDLFMSKQICNSVTALRKTLRSQNFLCFGIRWWTYQLLWPRDLLATYGKGWE